MKNKIDIPKPCSEKWDYMTSSEKDKLCMVCNRKVYDFTNYNAREIINFVDSQSKICGKLKFNQLESNSSFFRKLGALISISSLLSFPNLTYAKSNNHQIQFEVQKLAENNQIQILNDISGDSILISGTVTESGIPLPKALVKLKGTDIETQTDFNGNFNLTIPSNKKSKIIILEFSHVGMFTIEVKVKKLNRKLKVELQSEYIIGEVIYKKTLWRKIFG